MNPYPKIYPGCLAASLFFDLNSNHDQIATWTKLLQKTAIDNEVSDKFIKNVNSKETK